MTSLTSIEKIDSLFEAQRQNYIQVGKSSTKQRKKKLRRFLKAILKYEHDICQALHTDLHRSHEESRLIEIYPLLTELRHAIAHLHRWNRAVTKDKPIILIGTSSKVVPQSKGVVLIMAPWNFPVSLTFSPLIYALAAGNTAILKPSEFTPACYAIMEKIITECFAPEEVAIVNGEAKEAEYLTRLPFDHIFFTGSPAIGKRVMTSAAEHLTSVTLELGGKSPTIIDSKANLERLIPRVAWGKLLNAGQICIAPDYMIVHEDKLDAVIQILKESWKKFDVKAETSTWMVKGPSKGQFVYPSIVVNPPENDPIHSEEIFSPILLIYTYESKGEIWEILQNKTRPLVTYIMSDSRSFVDEVISHSRSGAYCVNHTTVYFFNPNLPFGGSGFSGIGRSHGYEGFRSFSNMTSKFVQRWPLSLTTLIYPPYSPWKKKLIQWMIRWL